MSLRLIARDLYRLQQEVGRLEQQLATTSSGQCDGLKKKLAMARAEQDQMRRILDGRLDR